MCFVVQLLSNTLWTEDVLRPRESGGHVTMFVPDRLLDKIAERTIRLPSESRSLVWSFSGKDRAVFDFKNCRLGNFCCTWKLYPARIKHLATF